MNLLNRFVVVLVLLLGIVFWIAMSVLVVFWPLIDKGFLRQAGEGLVQAPSIQLQPAFVLVFALLSIVVVILLLITLWYEIVPSKPTSVKVKTANGTTATIPVDTIADRVRYEAEQVAGVATAKPKVNVRRGSVDLEVRVVSPPSVAVGPLSDEVSAGVKRAVEQDLGVPVGNLAIRVQLDGSAKVQRQASAVRDGSATPAP